MTTKIYILMLVKKLSIYRLENGDFELRRFPNNVLLTGMGLDTTLGYAQYLMTTDPYFALVSNKVFEDGDSDL